MMGDDIAAMGMAAAAVDPAIRMQRRQELEQASASNLAEQRWARTGQHVVLAPCFSAPRRVPCYFGQAQAMRKACTPSPHSPIQPSIALYCHATPLLMTACPPALLLLLPCLSCSALRETPPPPIADPPPSPNACLGHPPRLSPKLSATPQQHQHLRPKPSTLAAPLQNCTTRQAAAGK